MAQPLPPLSAGAVQAIADGATDVKAVVQVIGIKPVPNKGDGKQRHRLALSDGQNWITAVPATQLDDLVASKAVDVGSVIRLQEYLFNHVNSRQVVILLQLDNLGRLDKLAECTEVNKGQNAANTSNAGPPLLGGAGPGPYAAINGGAGHAYGNGTTSGYGGGAAGGFGGPPAANGYATGVAPPAAGGYGGPPAAGGYGGSLAYGSGVSGPQQPGGGYYGPGRAGNAAAGYGGTGGYGGGAAGGGGGGYGGYGGGSGGGGYGQNPQYRGHGPIARNEAPPRIVPINSLNSYQSHWTIKARITHKSEIRRYSNARGEGKLFSFELLDAQGGEIRGCAFNQCVDKFEPIMQQGAVIMMSKASLKNKRPGSSYSNNRHEYEITLEPSTVIEICEEEDKAIPTMQYHFIKIKQLNDKFANETADVMGVVDRVEPTAVIQTRDGKELTKRNVSIRDDSGASVDVTLWGNTASDPGNLLEESFNNGAHPILALKNAKIGDYNGRTLSTVSTTTLTIDPDVPEAGHLRHWFDSAGGAAAPVSTLTSGSGSVGGSKSDRRVTLATIKEEAMGANSQTAYVQIVCTITFVKSDPIAYPACTLQYNGKQCNKKVTDSGGGDGPNRWWCERCSAACEAEWRYMLSLNIEDHSGKEWVTAFQEEGKQIIGYTANEMQELKDAESPLFESRLNDIKCRSYLFKLRVSEDTWQDEQRIRINVVRVDPVDFVRDSKQLVEYISKLTLNVPIMQPLPAAGAGGGGYGGGRMPGNAGGMYEASGGGAGYNSYGGAAPQQMQTSPYSVQRPGGPGIYGGPPTGSPGYGGGGYGGAGYRGGGGGGGNAYGGGGGGYGGGGGGYGGGGGGYGGPPQQQQQQQQQGGGMFGGHGRQEPPFGGGNNNYHGPGGF